jgi:hypothetical protein
MVHKWYCDFCNKEVNEVERHTLNLGNKDEYLIHYDLCPNCSTELQKEMELKRKK